MGATIIVLSSIVVVYGFLRFDQGYDPRGSILIMLVGLLAWVWGNIYLISERKRGGCRMKIHVNKGELLVIPGLIFYVIGVIFIDNGLPKDDNMGLLLILAGAVLTGIGFGLRLKYEDSWRNKVWRK